MRKLINLIALLIMASSVTWAQDKEKFHTGRLDAGRKQLL